MVASHVGGDSCAHVCRAMSIPAASLLHLRLMDVGLIRIVLHIAMPVLAVSEGTNLSVCPQSFEVSGGVWGPVWRQGGCTCCCEPGRPY